MRFKKVRFTFLPFLALFIMGVLGAGCSQDSGIDPRNTGPDIMTSGSELSTTSTEKSLGGYAIEAKYSHIDSYPTGGGIFVLRLVPDEGFTGTVNLSLSAISRLNAALDRVSVTAASPVFEVTVRPSKSIPLGIHTIEVRATCGGETLVLPLEVEVVNWSGWGSGNAENELAEFYDWLAAEHPELGSLIGLNWFTYGTYPGILIVEHWTFLDAEYELRLCFHVMIPPYDWSKIMIRPRGQWDPILAAHRETDGTIYEIPVEEYPIMMGY